MQCNATHEMDPTTYGHVHCQLPLGHLGEHHWEMGVHGVGWSSLADEDPIEELARAIRFRIRYQELGEALSQKGRA